MNQFSILILIPVDFSFWIIFWLYLYNVKGLDAIRNPLLIIASDKIRKQFFQYSMHTLLQLPLV